MNCEKIKTCLKDYDHGKVCLYIDYIKSLLTATNRDKTLKNPWAKYKSDDDFVSYFKKVSLDGLTFDGVHITLQSTGISYDYIAYKNLMYTIYPESLIDVALIYKDDTFKFAKRSGKVIYTHSINNPFDQREDTIVGGYCVIKNKRGEFITLLSKSNIEKHRKVAKTDKIWAQWFHEMCMKTLVKKACKQHFADIYQNIETLDNEETDLGQSLDIDIKDKQAVENMITVEALKEFYLANKGRNSGILKDFNILIANRKEEIVKNENTQRDNPEVG